MLYCKTLMILSFFLALTGWKCHPYCHLAARYGKKTLLFSCLGHIISVDFCFTMKII